MTVGNSTLYFSYDASGVPMSVKYGDSEYYYTSNIQGDVTGIVNDQGQTVVTYTYDAWGNILSCTGSDAATLGALNPLRYRGYVFDQETNLYYLQSRYYNPEIGRFINADGMIDTGQGLLGNNMFAYCLNNPGNMYDSNGACSRFLGFLWKVDCGKATCKQSKNYKPTPLKVAVLYDGRTSGVFLYFGGKGFKYYGESLVDTLESTYEVESYSFSTMDGFVDAWNSLDGGYDKIYILSHGYAGGLSCNGKSISNSGREAYSFWDLDPVYARTVYLYSCNGATLSEYGSVASCFAYLTGGEVWAVQDGSLGYIYGTHIPIPTDGGRWVRTQ